MKRGGIPAEEEPEILLENRSRGVFVLKGEERLAEVPGRNGRVGVFGAEQFAGGREHILLKGSGLVEVSARAKKICQEASNLLHLVMIGADKADGGLQRFAVLLLGCGGIALGLQDGGDAS